MKNAAKRQLGENRFQNIETRRYAKPTQLDKEHRID